MVAEEAFLAAAREWEADRGSASKHEEWTRCFLREVAVRAALAAMVDFGLGE